MCQPNMKEHRRGDRKEDKENRDKLKREQEIKKVFNQKLLIWGTENHLTSKQISKQGLGRTYDYHPITDQRIICKGTY